MSSTSTTDPPPAIGWNVQDSDWLLLACHKRLHKNSVQVGREFNESHKEHGGDDRHGYVIGCATQRQRDRSRTQGKENLQPKYPLPPIGSARSTREESDRHGQGNHVGHSIVTAQQSGAAPYSDRNGLDHCPDLIARLPQRSTIGSEGRFPRLVKLQIDRPENSGHGEKRDTCPDEIASGL